MANRIPPTLFSTFHLRHRSFSTNHNIVRRNVLRKMKQNVERLPSQGRDPASFFKKPWRLASAGILERYPIITPDVDEFEARYLTDRFLARQRNARGVPKEFFLSERDVLEGKSEATFEDAYAEMYRPADRVTEADRLGDVKSLERGLDERLYFVVRRKEGKWQFPQVLVEDGMGMVESAERVLKGVVGRGWQMYFLSSAPSCCLEHVYSAGYQEKHDVYGVKVFFYRAMLLEGEQVGDGGLKNGMDYMWAKEEELEDCLGGEVYQGIKSVLLGNGPRVKSTDVFEGNWK